MHRLAYWFGLISTLIALIILFDVNVGSGTSLGLIFSPATVDHLQSAASTNLMLIWLTIVSLSLYYSAKEIKQGHTIGYKVFPACCVAYFLTLCVIRYWLVRPTL